MMQLKIQLTQKYSLSAIHQLDSHCHPEGGFHGHNFNLEVSVSGSIHEQSGLVISRDFMDHVVEKRVLLFFNKKNLNKILEFPSGEYLVKEIFNRLKSSELGEYLCKIALQETPKNRFEYP